MSEEVIKGKILFVDDEPNILLGLQRLLRSFRREWDMSFVNSGDEALAELKKSEYHIIVSDLRMPKMNGVELLERVQAEYPDMVRFILSGHADTDLIIQSVGAAHQFLAKPCDAEILQNAIVRAVKLRNIFKSDILSDIIQDGASLPTLPDLYYKLTELLKSPNSSAEKIAEIIAQDISMSAKILQIVNSAFFGLSRHVDSISHAVALLGAETINNIMITTSVFGAFDEETVEKYDISQIYAHALQVGRAASKLVKAVTKERKLADEAMLAGMVHDLGKLVFINSAHEEWSEVYLNRHKEDKPLFVQEKEALGITHSEVGAYLLGLWGLSNHIAEAVAFHHTPDMATEKEFGTLAALHIADTLEINNHASYKEKLELNVDYLTEIGLSEAQIEEYCMLCDIQNTDDADANSELYGNG